jgi:hypothetical protein
MKRTAPPPPPRMRARRLVIDDLPDEVLVYDLDRHQAHCLNQSAALVWRACDGNLAPRQIARKLTAELDCEFSEGLVSLALSQLEKIHLLEGNEAWSSQLTVLSRRQMVRHLGLTAAVAVPVVISIVVPTPVQAGSCKHANSTCNTGAECCSGNCAPGAPPKCLGG